MLVALDGRERVRGRVTVDLSGTGEVWAEWCEWGLVDRLTDIQTKTCIPVVFETARKTRSVAPSRCGLRVSKTCTVLYTKGGVEWSVFCSEPYTSLYLTTARACPLFFLVTWLWGLFDLGSGPQSVGVLSAEYMHARTRRRTGGGGWIVYTLYTVAYMIEEGRDIRSFLSTFII